MRDVNETAGAWRTKRLVLEKRLSCPKWIRIGMPVFAVVLGLLFAAVFIRASGAKPLEVYKAMFEGSFGSLYALSETGVKMIPLLLIAVGCCISFRMGLWNAGAEGQIYIAGAVSTWVIVSLPTTLPTALTLLLAFLAAFVSGGLYGLIAGVLKLKWNISELIVTLMLNYIGTLFINYLLQGPLKDPNTYTPMVSKMFDHNGQLPTIGGTRLHYGLFIALFVAIACWWVFSQTCYGFELKLIGSSRQVALYSGVNFKKYVLIAMFISAGICGMAGANEVCGITHRLSTKFANDLGFSGMTVAYLAQLNPLACILVSLLFGALMVGGSSMQRIGLPTTGVQMLQGSILFFVVMGDVMTKYRIVLKKQ